MRCTGGTPQHRYPPPLCSKSSICHELHKHMYPAMEVAQRNGLLCPYSLRGQPSFKALPKLQRGQAGPARHSIRNRTDLQRRFQRQQTCAANPFDLAWGTSVNVDAQVGTLPRLDDMPCFMSLFQSVTEAPIVLLATYMSWKTLCL